VIVLVAVPAGSETDTVPPPVALKPAPLVVVMSRPLPPVAGVKLIVAPVLLVRLTAAFAAVLRLIVLLRKLIVPPLLLVTSMPAAVAVLALIEPFWKVTVPASCSLMLTALPLLSVIEPLKVTVALLGTAPVPLITNASPTPLCVIVVVVTPVWPNRNVPPSRCRYRYRRRRR
jgi:hypothetical protein